VGAFSGLPRELRTRNNMRTQMHFSKFCGTRLAHSVLRCGLFHSRFRCFCQKVKANLLANKAYFSLCREEHISGSRVGLMYQKAQWV
jgi:hypothetical protein